MIGIEIEGIPVSWKAHQGYGRRSFNPRYKEREYYQWQIRSQWNQSKPIGGPVRVQIVFFVPCPKSSAIRTKQMLNGIIHPIKRPDLDNLNKFVLDCLKTIVFEDDSQVVEINSKKVFSDHPRTLVKIEVI